MIFLAASFMFLIFSFSGLLGEYKGKKKWPMMTKKIFLLHFSGTIHCYLDLWYTCVRITSPDAFSIFSKFSFSGSILGQKGKRSWSCFLLHKFKIMTSPDAFFHFLKILVFSVVSKWGVRREEWGWWKFFLALHLRNCISYDCDFWYTCVKWWYLLLFFHFFKSLTFWAFQSSSINTKRKFWGVPHLLHMCMLFGFMMKKRHFQKKLLSWLQAILTSNHLNLSDLPTFLKGVKTLKI